MRCSLRSLKLPLSLSIALFTFAAFHQTALANPAYDIVELGLTDAEHTNSRGNQKSRPVTLSATGLVTGYSDRYEGTEQNGTSAWAYDNGSTVRLGYTGPGYVATDGEMESSIELVTDAGQVFGYSQKYEGYAPKGRTYWVYENGIQAEFGMTDPDGLLDYISYDIRAINQTGTTVGIVDRYSGSTSLGKSAWYYENGIFQEIGLTDVLHTRSDGYRRNGSSAITDSGYMLGSADSFSDANGESNSPWIYDGQTTTRIGLYDAEHTSSTGLQISYSNNINEMGYATGTSYRLDGESGGGLTAWLYDGTSTMPVGLYDADHTRSDGWQYSSAGLLETGAVVGTSKSYTSNDAEGSTAWLYDGNSYIKLGFQDAVHTSQYGVQESGVNTHGGSGYLFGSSTRYQPSGRTAWVYDGFNLTEVGLASGEHISGFGFRSSYVLMANDAGQAAGISDRYTGDTTHVGNSAWFWENGVTTQIGVSGLAHTSGDGTRLERVELMNEAGQVAGYSIRYSGVDEAGQSAWIYDSAADQTCPLIFSVRSDGYAFSEVGYLDDNGLALGYYKLFDPVGDAYLGTRAFGWTRDHGAFDLGLTIAGGLDETDWAYLADAIEANSSGWIVGYGELLGAEYYTPFPGVPFGYYINQRDLAYLLIPANEHIAGDLNGDGFVGIDDLNLILSNWNQTVPPADPLADPSGDGFVGIDDLNEVLGNWNAGTPPNAAALPEPASLGVCVLGSIAFMRRVR